MGERIDDERIDALDFVHYVCSRWRWVTITCTTAVLLAGITSAVLPKRYTASATLMIDPPAGADARSATAVSPVYLDSLKTYEHLASSDSLFLEALDHLKIRGRYASRSVESLKRGILQISRPVNTRIIDISATLDDPRTAQGLAQYIAERTVALNHALDERTEADASRDAEAVLARARDRAVDAQKASDEFASTATIAALSDEIQNAGDLKFRAERDLGEAKTEVAVQNAGSQPSLAARAKVADLQGQADAFGLTVQSKSALLERSQERRDQLDIELHAARVNLESARARVDEIRTSSAFRSERLDVLDPGIVPERPSYPNTPLNIVLAFLLGLTLSTVWLAIRFGYERTRMVRIAERAYALR